MYTFRRFAAYSAAVAPRTYLEINNHRLRWGAQAYSIKYFFGGDDTHLSCHNVQAVFNGIPLFSELSSSFRDFLDRCGDLLLSSELPSSSFETQLCKKAVDNIGEALGSTAISAAVLWNHNKLRHECSTSSIVCHFVPLPPLAGKLFWLHSSPVMLNLLQFLENPTKKPSNLSIF